MKTVYIHEGREKEEFAMEAAKYFAANEGCRSYTRSGGINAGELFALRWGLGEDCVVVFRIDEATEPVNYAELVRLVEG